MCHLKLMFRINMGQPLTEASLDPRYHSSCSIYLTFSMNAKSGTSNKIKVRRCEGFHCSRVHHTKQCPQRNTASTPLGFVEKTARRSMLNRTHKLALSETNS